MEKLWVDAFQIEKIYVVFGSFAGMKLVTMTSFLQRKNSMWMN